MFFATMRNTVKTLRVVFLETDQGRRLTPNDLQEGLLK